MLLPNYFALLRDFARLLVSDDQKSRASKVSRVKLVAENSKNEDQNIIKVLAEEHRVPRKHDIW